MGEKLSIAKIIGRNIKEHRMELGLTQLQLAYKIGINSKTTIADVEAGRTNLHINILLRYAEALECTVEDLLKGYKYQNTK